MTDDGAATRCDPKGSRPADPIETVRALLAAGNSDEIIAMVADLVANNAVLRRQLAERSGKRLSTSEIVSKAQLLLLLDNLAPAGADDEPDQSEQPDELSKANDVLATAADLDALRSDPADDNDKKRKKRKRPDRRSFPDKLRRVTRESKVADEHRACPECGEPRVCIGHDVTETLELSRPELIVVQHRQEKVACKTKDCPGSVCRAPGPDKVIDGGRLGVQLVSCLVVDKYRDGLPLHRQQQRFRRLGVDIPMSTLVDQIKHVGNAGKVLQQAALLEVLASHVMQMDGTGMPVLDKAHRDGTRYGSLWGYVGDGQVSVYLYASTGKKTGQRKDEEGGVLERGPEDVLKQRAGLVVADASNLFDASFKREDLIECGCNAHGRRRFVAAVDGGDSRAALVVGAYRRLYEVEREARDKTVEERTKLRQDKSRPVFDAILAWCQAYKPHEPPRSPLGEAIRYFTNHHEALGRFIDDGSIPIDNSLVERQHVRVALTRKNFLFVGSDEGGERAAVIYTLLGSCELAGVDPEQYLADVLPRLARGVTPNEARELLPHRWKLGRASA